MGLISTPTRYGAVAQLFHWLTAILVAAAYLLGEGGPESRVFAPERALTLSAHETLGSLVLLLLLLRLGWRLIDHLPQGPPMPLLMRAPARLVHIALFLLLALVPLTAILGSWYSEHPLTLLGVGSVGSFVAPAPQFGNTLLGLHGALANAILILAGLHALAALFHHFVLRDRVLLSMLPFGRIPSSHLAVTTARAEPQRVE